ncbi:DUF6787 family protein [Aquimarina pacifica]|uniref:DUF6787 family protein n=1 Tax=Aquimarina pacifica TaxID=1296415 RepID=UPI0004728C29|nr:DUF6787 family protein [Aquimarina pacifica]
MESFKNKWEIKQNWQLVFPALGIIGLVISSYLIGKSISKHFLIENEIINSSVLLFLTSLFTVFFLFITLKIFGKLESRWEVTYRWELIAIFIVFAITGSTSARISDPIIHFIGLSQETTSGWLYWPLRILLIFPIYQVLLVFVGWLFGQFKFFWTFEKKMLSRLGFARFFKD